MYGFIVGGHQAVCEESLADFPVCSKCVRACAWLSWCTHSSHLVNPDFLACLHHLCIHVSMYSCMMCVSACTQKHSHTGHMNVMRFLCTCVFMRSVILRRICIGLAGTNIDSHWRRASMGEESESESKSQMDSMCQILMRKPNLVAVVWPCMADHVLPTTSWWQSLTIMVTGCRGSQHSLKHTFMVGIRWKKIPAMCDQWSQDLVVPWWLTYLSNPPYWHTSPVSRNLELAACK